MAKTATTVETKSVEVGFSTEVREALARFNRAKAEAKVVEDEKRDAEKTLRDALGEDATVATVGGVKVYSLEHRSRTVIDAKRLEKDYPEIFKAISHLTEYDFIKSV